MADPQHLTISLSPDKNGNWINQVKNDFSELAPMFDKDGEQSIFGLYSNGSMTGRNEWVYDFSEEYLKQKAAFFLQEYNHEVERWEEYKRINNYQDIKDESNPVVDNFLHQRNIIKWSKMIKRDKLRKGKIGRFDPSKIRKAIYCPFVWQYLYFDYIPIDLKGQDEKIFPQEETENKSIWLKTGSAWPFFALAVKTITNYLPQGGSSSFAFARYDDFGNRIDNITNWALSQFQDNYVDDSISKLAIFHYVYAVLNHPAYCQKYRLNLKREFPRIPFYDDFWQWSAWGEHLMDLHINYETIEPYRIQQTNIDPETTRKAYKAKLKANKDKGVIELDTLTILSGIPATAWEYKLGNRSALEWVLDRYKESKPRDPTIREKFNTYRFLDYKEQVIDLLQRVAMVRLETMKIIEAMNTAYPPEAKESDQ